MDTSALISLVPYQQHRITPRQEVGHVYIKESVDVPKRTLPALFVQSLSSFDACYTNDCISSSATSARTVNRREIRGRQFRTFVSSLGHVSAKWWTCSWSKLENSSKWWLPAPITNRYFGVTASPPPGQKPPPCAQSVPRLPSLSPES